MNTTHHRRGATNVAATALGILLFLILITCVKSCSIIQPGTVGVQVTFGSADDRPLIEGAHVVAPWSTVRLYNVAQQTLKEEHVLLPSQDQLMTTVDVSVQFRFIGADAAKILRDTGTEEQAIAVHLEPKLRSALREVSKGVAKAEDFFQDAIQVKLQNELEKELAAYCLPKGISIQSVLLRDMQLPPIVTQTVNAKKQKEQEAVQQQAVLQQFTIKQQEQVAKAEADKQAAAFEAEKVKIAADAEAYKIKAISAAASANPVYVQLEALKTLVEMAKDPAAKFYFMDGQGQSPLPLLHMGDVVAPPARK